MVNRSAILLEPRAPYITWANALDADGPRYEDCLAEDDFQTVYLGPDCDSVEEVRRFIKKNFDLFFESELEMWCTAPHLWPQRRTYRMFTDWFTVRIHTVIEDTVAEPLLDDQTAV